MGESAEELLVTIAKAVSDALNMPIEELPPLSQSVDLEGLKTVITQDRSHDVTVIFSYAAHKVLVHSDRTVYVRPIQTDTTNRWEAVNAYD